MGRSGAQQPPPRTNDPRARPPPSPPDNRDSREHLQGAYADKYIHVGEDYQAEVPDFIPDVPSGRADELLHIEHTPLTAPPPPAPIVSLSTFQAQATVSKSTANLNFSESDEEDDFDSSGQPRLPPGVKVGDFCLASCTQAGETKMFKAILLGVRRLSPCLLVKFIALPDSSKNLLLLPAVRKSYVTTKQVRPWNTGAPAPAPAISAAEASHEDEHDEGESSTPVTPLEEPRALRKRQPKPELQLLAEAGGLRLHLDPKRNAPGYSGTGYKGVFNDYWPSGFKKYKPYTVVQDGKYHGRFATVEQAAVQYARLEMGMPPLRIETEDSGRQRANKRQR